jgi:hypothetical protein
MLVLPSHGTREDEMLPTIASEIAAQRIAELHLQAARRRLVRQLRTGGAAGPAKGRLRVGWARRGFRRPRSAAA